MPLACEDFDDARVGIDMHDRRIPGTLPSDITDLVAVVVVNNTAVKDLP
jgi:hypothetical protein